MFRKLVVRLFLCVVALVGIVVLAVCVAGYLALQPPAFYTELRAQEISAADQLAAKESWNAMERDLHKWCARSLGQQRTSWPSTIFNAFQSETDRTPETYSMTFTEKQINASLVSSTVNQNREWQHPRIHLGQGHADIGFEVVKPKANCVLSARLNATITSQGHLRIDLVSARIGQLPIPLRTIIGWLPRDAFHSGNDVELHLTDPTPHIYLDLSSNGPESPVVKAIKCVEDEITIELLPPVPKGNENEHRATPLALSGWK